MSWFEAATDKAAVTLEGNVIHKSGLITGGTGSTGGRKFNDEEVDSESHFRLC
jgi:structural maintenance of chromosome 1